MHSGRETIAKSRVAWTEALSNVDLRRVEFRSAADVATAVGTAAHRVSQSGSLGDSSHTGHPDRRVLAESLNLFMRVELSNPASRKRSQHNKQCECKKSVAPTSASGITLRWLSSRRQRRLYPVSLLRQRASAQHACHRKHNNEHDHDARNNVVIAGRHQ